MFNGIGFQELLIVLAIVLLIFGPKRLPGLGRSLGSSMREFKDSVTGKDHHDDDPSPAELPKAQPSDGDAQAALGRAVPDVAAEPVPRDEQ